MKIYEVRVHLNSGGVAVVFEDTLDKCISLSLALFENDRSVSIYDDNGVVVEFHSLKK